jgi:hypothetical protein
VRSAVALACAAGLMAAVSAQVPRPGHGARDARIAFRIQDGRPSLEVFSSPPGFVVDPHALRFTVRAFRGFQPDPDAPAQPLRVETGPAIAEPNAATRPAYTIALTVAVPPRPGMYELSTDALPGFARTSSGEELSISRFPAAGIGAIVAWWPDERNGDLGLRDVRARFAHRTVHGFGGVTMACPDWATGAGPETGVDIGEVTRETGHAEILHPGSIWGGDVGPRFIAFDPLALRVLDPPKPPVLPSPLPAPQPCDVTLRYADPWHVDTSIATAALPRLPQARPFPAAGMSRDEVVWLNGYPNEYGTASSLRAEDRWTYVAPTPFTWSVTFVHDRVVTVDPPGHL